MPDFIIGTSPDGRFAKVDVRTDEGEDPRLTAQNLELLIDNLANARAKLVPRVSQMRSPLLSPAPGIDALSPLLDVGLADSGHVILSVAYTGLGWRTAQLDPDEARGLARRLLDAAGLP